MKGRQQFRGPRNNCETCDPRQICAKFPSPQPLYLSSVAQSSMSGVSQAFSLLTARCGDWVVAKLLPHLAGCRVQLGDTDPKAFGVHRQNVCAAPSALLGFGFWTLVSAHA
jgi:hypothetical protein